MQEDIGCQKYCLSLAMTCIEGPWQLSENQPLIKVNTCLFEGLSNSCLQIGFIVIALSTRKAQLPWIAISRINGSLQKQDLVEILSSLLLSYLGRSKQFESSIDIGHLGLLQFKVGVDSDNHGDTAHDFIPLRHVVAELVLSKLPPQDI